MTQNNQIKKRIYYLDITRGFAIFGMFTQHCMIVHEVSAGEGKNLFANFFTLLGTAPSAPVFMLIMGALLMKSDSSMGRSIWRGIKLLILGFILNLLRFTIPLLIAVTIFGSDSLNLSEGETPLNVLFYVDIFQLAGLSIIFGALIKNIAEQKFFIPFLAAFVLLASPFLWGKFDSNPVSHFLWGVTKNVPFPFFPWVIYPLLGMYLSKYLIGIKSLKRSLKMIGKYGFFLGVLGGIMVLLSSLEIFSFQVFSPIGDYHRSGAGLHLVIIGFVFLWFNVCYWLEQKFGVENRIIKVLVYWSKNVTAIYFIQWVLFGWSMLIFDQNKQNAFDAALIGLTVLLITHFSVKKEGVRKLFSWI
ncbi:heparan-alpha-glucosaminide N-acetyltransferase domain-containing protein [Mastigocoleus sp. MO_188.B34]|uniref:heparan-alpha-glucosaminide N-acetyltransferase domain-containing protein n=1 Tax=Mastigocoleus sp. MO_188.B34 TaxID=3036635 RepID=UPI002603F93F|nr:heparan-alpha-glucosaminide N-acetyltransferase domain-containing protein [Mastigocoleus sp. MO_188.B34]MDJ0693536.1 heparan-alpha-glucosaminide N-acetyltransferase domain-containing protein [Mastigocoleus sp. MO_188.B34]